MDNYDADPFTFETKKWDDMKRAARSKPKWIYPQLINGASNLLYGESNTGKSYLVSALVASLSMGQPFLGVDMAEEFKGREWKVLLLTTDDDADSEYGERVESVLPEGASPDLEQNPLPIMRSSRHWDFLRDKVIEGGFNFVVIDSLTQSINGDMNSLPAVSDYFEGVRKLTRSGIPVVIIAHSSEKTNPQSGRKAETPLGHSSITGSVRHSIFMKRHQGRIDLKLYGNHVDEKWHMRLKPGAGARFTVVKTWTESESQKEFKEEQERQEANEAKREEKKQARKKETLSRNEKFVRFVLSDCQGLGVRGTGRKLAEAFPGTLTEASFISHLSRSSSFGAALDYDESRKAWSRAA